MAHPLTCELAGYATLQCSQNGVIDSTNYDCDTCKKSSGGGCFSNNMKAHVEGKDSVEMQHLNLGDRVLVANGTYESIYSFGHTSRDTLSDFLRLRTQSSVLELSKDHMVYAIDKPVPIPADQVKVGDILKVLFDGWNDSSSDDHGIVKKVTLLSRAGLFSSLTASGTIVVNNIVASTFTAISEDVEYTPILKVKGVEIGVKATDCSHLGDSQPHSPDGHGLEGGKLNQENLPALDICPVGFLMMGLVVIAGLVAIVASRRVQIMCERVKQNENHVVGITITAEEFFAHCLLCVSVYCVTHNVNGSRSASRDGKGN